MRYNLLGRTGLFVSELALGTMTFGGTDGMWKAMGGLDQAAADALVGQAIDAGINLIDTADVYGGGASETITGAAIRNLGLDREGIIVATKGFGQIGDAVNGRGASRRHLIAAADASLKRLGLDHVDLYQIHGFDAATGVEEQVRALDALVASGRVRYVGVSNWAAWQVAKAVGVSERFGLARPASVQAFYTLATRDLERDLVPMMTSEDVGLLVWSPLAGGLLTGKYAGGKSADGRLNDLPPLPVPPARLDAVLAELGRIADAYAATRAQVALAWLLHQPAVTSVIIGAKRPDQLADNLRAASVVLDADDLKALATASALPPEYPGWMIATQGAGRRAQLTPPPRGSD